METFSALLAICAGNSPAPGEFPTQRPVTRSFDVFFDLRLNKWLSKQSWSWWLETLSCPLWRHRNATRDCAILPVVIYHCACTHTCMLQKPLNHDWCMPLRSHRLKLRALNAFKCQRGQEVLGIEIYLHNLSSDAESLMKGFKNGS